MALGDPYVSLAEFKAYMQISDTVDDVRATDAINAASRDIEKYTHRQFNDAGVETARQFRTPSGSRVVADDFQDTAGLVVRSGSISGGFTTTLTRGVDYYIAPVDGAREEVPMGVYWRVRALSGYRFPSTGGEPNLEVTARWGWPEVPDDVVQATYIWAARLFRRRDSPEGVLGGFSDAPIRVGVKMDPDVRAQLAGLPKRGRGYF